MTSPFVTREASGLGPIPDRVSTNITPKLITVHYGGGSPWSGRIRTAADHDHNRCASIWRAWRDYHVNGNGWADIAYTSGVCPGGWRYEGRGPGRRTAANGTNEGNQVSYAVVYIAGDGDQLTHEAIWAFHDESARLVKPLQWPHKHWLPTGCPGDRMMEWVDGGFQQAPRPGQPAPPPAPQPQPLPPSSVPAFPLGAGQYFGPKTGGANSISGFYQRLPNGQPGHAGLQQWQQQMARRGWRLGADGLYGDETARVAVAFQREKGLNPDGKIGPYTWRVAWTAPVT